MPEGRHAPPGNEAAVASLLCAFPAIIAQYRDRQPLHLDQAHQNIRGIDSGEEAYRKEEGGEEVQGCAAEKSAM
jgi:hypothetical protein